jgi:hypothetical protein
MGAVLGVKVSMAGRIEERNLESKDDRRRNSLAYNISQFVSYEKDDFAPMIASIMKEKYSKTGGKPPVIKPSKFSKIADAIIQGNMRECRNQVIVFFKTINRKYKDQFGGNTLLHFACQEGYYNMVTFMANPANHSELDENELEINARNDRGRTPIFLCFTPPVATLMGIKYGVDSEGTILAEKPEDLEVLSDWIKPGGKSIAIHTCANGYRFKNESLLLYTSGPRTRQDIVQFLIEHGADVNDKDFQDFTILHLASIWGKNNAPLPH